MISPVGAWRLAPDHGVRFAFALGEGWSPFVFSPQDQGDDSLDSDVDSSGLTAQFSYTAGTADRTVDAALNSIIFADGFESGDTTMWSSTVP